MNTIQESSTKILSDSPNPYSSREMRNTKKGLSWPNHDVSLKRSNCALRRRFGCRYEKYVAHIRLLSWHWISKTSCTRSVRCRIFLTSHGILTVQLMSSTVRNLCKTMYWIDIGIVRCSKAPPCFPVCWQNKKIHMLNKVFPWWTSSHVVWKGFYYYGNMNKFEQKTGTTKRFSCL